MSDEETMPAAASHRSIHWFRKGLRLHDNPALKAACENCTELRPVFVLDPWFVKNYKVGVNRWRFLAETLGDLDESLNKLGARLYVVRGSPTEVFPRLFKEWKITRLTYEVDTEPYALTRDETIDALAKEHGVEVIKHISHTLYDTQKTIAKNGGSPPLTYQRCQKILAQMPAPPKPLDSPSRETLKGITFPEPDPDSDEVFGVPSLGELGVEEDTLGPCLYPGGETHALARMEKYLKRTNWICTFEKPKTEPNTLQPSTTVLSPYLKFGSLSPRLLYWKLQEIYKQAKTHSQPPVSLHGQLLWREFFYTVGAGTDNFNKMEGNTVCRQIPWKENQQHLEAWKNGRTGYPFIDAIMTQLREEGWIHHLARHSVACFLTRGDLWISWERGQEVFEELLLDADWFLNAGNWMWLSASAFFHQYYRVYSPIVFGKKTDKNGDYIKKYLPQLKKFPAQYIYEPWKAPLSVQKAAGCIIGEDYPKPIVDHDKAKDVNIARMKAAYASGKPEQNGEKVVSTPTPKKKRQNSDGLKDSGKGMKKQKNK